MEQVTEEVRDPVAVPKPRKKLKLDKETIVKLNASGPGDNTEEDFAYPGSRVCTVGCTRSCRDTCWCLTIFCGTTDPTPIV
jgi:hypothetical protein